MKTPLLEGRKKGKVALPARTKADGKVPLLTDVFQVDTTDLADMRELIDRYASCPELDANDWQQVPAPCWARLSAACRGARSRMDAIQQGCQPEPIPDFATEARIDWEAVKHIPAAKQLETWLRWRNIEEPIVLRYIPDNRYALVSKDQDRGQAACRLVLLVTEMIWDALADLQEDPEQQAKLKRCPECLSVFVARSRDTEFCSHRCNTRVSRRRRYQSQRGINK